MRKNYLLAIGLCCTMAGMVGCSDNDPMPDYSTPAGDVIAFNCHSSWGEGNKLIWTDMIQVGLFCEQTNHVNTALGVTALTANRTEGAFYTKTKWGAGEYRFYLYAPHNKDAKTTTIAGAIPAVQTQNGTSTAHIDQNTLIYASVKSAKPETLVDVPFEQALNYLDLKISTTKLNEWIPESITIDAPEGVNLVGGYTFNIESGKFALQANASNSVSMNISDVTLSSDAPFHAYMLTAPFVTTAEVECAAKVKVSKDGEQTKELSGKLKFPGGVAGRQVVVVPVDLDAFTSSEVEDTSIDLCDPTGSGTPVTANCYIAGAPGQDYRFDATVMGNGYTTPSTTDYTGGGTAEGIIPETLDPKSAKLLWQTAPTLISNVKLSNKQVYFKLNGTLDGSDLIEGNALIAVYDGENGTGNILWSWHIWVTAEDLGSKLTKFAVPEKYAEAGESYVMDRNLGALKPGMWGVNKDNLALGLLYQWGRKDPFLNIDDSTIGGTAALAITLTRASYDAKGTLLGVDNGGTASTAFAPESWLYFVGKTIPKAEIARYPMNFGHLAANANWIEEPADDLWGNPFSKEIGQTGHKSIYDPCPAGYRVPNRYFATGATTDGENAPIGDARSNAANKDKASYQAAGGNSFSNIGFPAGGMLFLSTKIVPFRTGIYVGHYQLSMPAETVNNSYRFYIDYGNVKPMDNNARYIGGSVRCVKE